MIPIDELIENCGNKAKEYDQIQEAFENEANLPLCFGESLGVSKNICCNCADYDECSNK